MTKVIVSEDCGNSPKNIFLEELAIAFARGDHKFILDSVTDDICWRIIGGSLVEGKNDLAGALQQMKSDPTVELTIEHVATHGKTGAVDGTRKQKNGKKYAFCDVVEFNGAKGSSIKEIISYVIEIG